MHPDARYAESSAAWVLIASILVFFMVIVKRWCCPSIYRIYEYILFRKQVLCCLRSHLPEIQRRGDMLSFWYVIIYTSSCLVTEHEHKLYPLLLQKHQDAFASAFGFFLVGYDVISQYLSTNPTGFFRISDPVLWFFKVC